MAEHEQPDWLCKIPFDVLNLIAQSTRNAVKGLTTFRSVCRTWRAAVGPAPRLLPPSRQNVADVLDNFDYKLVYPLSRGWSIVVDARDVSSHLSHLATGTTVALPKLNAVCDGGAASEIRHLFYQHLSDLEVLFSSEDPAAECSERETTPPDVDEAESAGEGSWCEKNVCEDLDEKPVDDQEVPSSEHLEEQFTDDEADSFDMDSLYRKYNISPVVYHYPQQHKIKIHTHYGHHSYGNYHGLSNYFRFAVHIPTGTPAGTTEGMVIMMYHRLHGSKGIVFCRPGDTAWTMVCNPNSDTILVDFAYFDGKMFAMDSNCVTLVFDAMTLEVLYQIDVPPATLNFGFRLCGGSDREEFEYPHLVALPHKLLLVKVLMNRNQPHGPYAPYGFHVFELGSGSEDDEGLAWRRVTMDKDVGGNYEILMDAYHTTYSNNGAELKYIMLITSSLALLVVFGDTVTTCKITR